MDQQTGVQAQIARGDTLLKRGNVREAAEEFAGVVRAEPGDPAGHLGLAEASLALGDFATTRQACAQVQQLAPQSAEGALARALVAVLDQRFDVALDRGRSLHRTGTGPWLCACVAGVCVAAVGAAL